MKQLLHWVVGYSPSLFIMYSCHCQPEIVSPHTFDYIRDHGDKDGIAIVVNDNDGHTEIYIRLLSVTAAATVRKSTAETTGLRFTNKSGINIIMTTALQIALILLLPSIIVRGQ